jgi:serine/threonine-protein kinase RsbW/stage II sporulation protein AB (anti-sigma F factor)
MPMPRREALSVVPQHPDPVSDADAVLTLDARPENVAVLRQAAAAAAAAAGFPEERREDVTLAVGEACANVVTHAYPDGHGTIALLIDADADGLVLTVRDWGAGIGPRPDSPGLGLGIPLIGALADRLELAGAGDAPTDVRMTFLHGAQGPSGETEAPGS